MSPEPLQAGKEVADLPEIRTACLGDLSSKSSICLTVGTVPRQHCDHYIAKLQGNIDDQYALSVKLRMRPDN